MDSTRSYGAPGEWPSVPSPVTTVTAPDPAFFSATQATPHLVTDS